MSRTTFASALAMLWTSLSALHPAYALSRPSDGGLQYGSTDATPARGEGGTLLVRTAVILGRTLRVQGTMAHGMAGRPVAVQRQEKDGGWVLTATAVTTAGGSFDARWITDHIGRFALRALAPTDAGASASAAAAPTTGQTSVTVYRQGLASFYGPGFFGRRTACGRILRRAMLGVAHPALPCGTVVNLYYKGRTVTVPVIDRGPFHLGRIWDLTEATAALLRFTGTGTIGALRMPRALPAGP